ncbi:MAG: hypothetical protein CM15mP75_0110 [Flammeovirgaceae bacterium]|nr:MAG: hypothetical protein CM15mP75_0110 [Flammeovirgaceae bacterium]
MTIEIKPLTIHTGAEISGVDITNPCRKAMPRNLGCFLKWKVVVFRESKMDHAQQVAFAGFFGDLTIGHAVFGHVDGYPRSIRSLRTAGITVISRRRKYSSLGGLPRRYYRSAQSASRLHSAWRYHSALWRRHILGETCRSV